LIVAGVDEAGRGSVLGPLVVAAVSIEESKVAKLAEIGVRDSKLLTPRRRRSLFKEIKRLAQDVVVNSIAPKLIDDYVLNGTRLFKLNYLEAKHMARALSQLDFDLAYVDCCDVNRERYGKLISKLVLDERTRHLSLWPRPRISKQMRKFRIKSEHHADRDYLVVGAASIIAKVSRDSRIGKLQRVHGELGSGYPSDPETVSYLKGAIRKSEDPPELVRASWETVRRLIYELEKPSTLDDFRDVSNGPLLRQS
jgi:ribonuclease HII